MKQIYLLINIIHIDFYELTVFIYIRNIKILKAHDIHFPD